MNHPNERRRRLDEVALTGGQFAILAIDHIDSLASVLDPDDPASISDRDLRGVKVQVVGAMQSQVGAVLLDPLVGFRGDRAEFGLSAGTGLVLGIEDGDYTRKDAEPRLLEGWSVGRAAELGASAVKISFYFDPWGVTTPAEAFVSMVVGQCDREAMPVFVEPLVAVHDPERRRQGICEGVRRFGSLGGDVLKIEFPASTEASSATEWREACEEIEAHSPVPWTLLSAGQDFDKFHSMLTVACEAGASGFVAGRTAWREAARSMSDVSLGVERLAALTALAASKGRNWRDRQQQQMGAPR